MEQLEPTLSVYFDNDRTYLTLVEPDAKGISLAYVNSTTQPMDISTGTDGQDPKGVAELNEVMLEIAGAANIVTAAIPMDVVQVRFFPAPPTMDHEDIRKLSMLEIKHNMSNRNVSDFEVTVYPVSPKIDGQRMMMMTMVEKRVLAAVRELLAPLGGTIERIEIAQLAAHACYAYNYPLDGETAKTVLIIGVQGKYIDISVIKQRNIAYYNCVSVPSSKEIGIFCAKELQKILEENVPFIDTVYVFGSRLTQPILDDITSAMKNNDLEDTLRLNSFRLVTTTLGVREREYCSRTTHIFAPCLGSAFPSMHKGLVL